MQILENFALKALNTFSIDVSAKYFSSFSNIDELNELLSFQPSQPNLILGGGSNILFTKNFDGKVIKNEIIGIEKIREDEKHIYVRAGAGENWHGFVTHALQQEWAGIENLSLIPG